MLSAERRRYDRLPFRSTWSITRRLRVRIPSAQSYPRRAVAQWQSAVTSLIQHLVGHFHTIARGPIASARRHTRLPVRSTWNETERLSGFNPRPVRFDSHPDGISVQNFVECAVEVRSDCRCGVHGICGLPVRVRPASAVAQLERAAEVTRPFSAHPSSDHFL
jgi:hypothetical protein